MKKSNYIGAPLAFDIALLCQAIHSAYPRSVGIYQVGSSLDRPDFRDIDLRMIMFNTDFHTRFPGYQAGGSCDALWALTVTCLSEYLSKRSGAKIDFQIQSMAEANKYEKQRRDAIFLTVPANQEIKEQEGE